MHSLTASTDARACAIMSTPIGQMYRLEKKHPLAIRWFHWINFPVLALMIWSGLLIYWANDVYRVGVGGLTLFHFFPGWFYSLFTLDGRLAEGMAWHFLFMWLFVLNGIAYVTYTLVSGDSLDSVAKKFDTSIHALAKLNKIPKDMYRKLKTGTVLQIPPAKSDTTTK